MKFEIIRERTYIDFYDVESDTEKEALEKLEEALKTPKRYDMYGEEDIRHKEARYKTSMCISR